MIRATLMAMFGQNKPAWGDAVAHPIYTGFQPAGATGATGAIGATGIVTGCVGATGPITVTQSNSTLSGRMAGLPYIDELPRNLSEVTKVIRPHRRIYSGESCRTESMLNFIRNRVLVRTVEYYARNEDETIIGRYIEWLDDHNCGLYKIDETANKFEFVISFEMEPDMIQFTLALR